MIDWTKISDQDAKIIADIAERAVSFAMEAGFSIPLMHIQMDVSAAHITCPLKLNKLLKADDGNFGHDVFGIRHHLNRETGLLEDCFVPRYALHQ